MPSLADIVKVPLIAAFTRPQPGTSSTAPDAAAAGEEMDVDQPQHPDTWWKREDKAAVEKVVSLSALESGDVILERQQWLDWLAVKQLPPRPTNRHTRAHDGDPLALQVQGD